MPFSGSKLGGVQQGERIQLETCIKLLLLWVAASDGTLDDAELDFTASRFPDVDGAAPTRKLLAAIRKPDLAVIEAALRVLADQSRELRTAFLDTAIAMTMADSRIALTENHLLRFYADALYLGKTVLERRFRAISGSALPEPGDPGNPQWWETHSLDDFPPVEIAPAPPQQPQATAETSVADLTAAQARSVLGVDEDAGPDEIEAAYRNLTKLFDLARAAPMGEAAVRVAATRLKRIQQAYDVIGGDQT